MDDYDDNIQLQQKKQHVLLRAFVKQHKKKEKKKEKNCFYIHYKLDIFYLHITF
jgi:hypothetical protein